MLALYNVSNFVSYVSDCLLPPNKEVTVSFEEIFAMLQTGYVAGMGELKVFFKTAAVCSGVKNVRCTVQRL